MYNRFARREDVFADPEEATEFVDFPGKVKQRDELTVYAWAPQLINNGEMMGIAGLAIFPWVTVQLRRHSA